MDFVYSLNVLEHIKDDKDIISKLELLLKEKGEMYLYLPAFPCLYSSLDKLVGHYRRYTKKSLVQLFNSNVWEIKEVKYADFLGFFVTLLFKLIGNKKGTISPLALKIFDKYIFPISCLFDKITRGKICGKNIMIHIVKK